MPRREIGTRWDRENRNNINENFKELYDVQDRAIEEATQAIVDSAKLVWLEPVNTFADIPTTYPNPEVGHTVFVRDTGKVYRFYNGSWMEIQQIDAGPVNEVDTRLSAEIEENRQEISQARTKADGTTFPVLRDRLNDVDDKIGILNKSKTEWVNIVEKYGADPTGTYDSSTAIQNALNNEIDKTIYFPTGTYLLNQQINLPLTTPFRLVGDGKSTIIKANAPMTAMFYKGVGYVSRSAILNMDLDANRKADYCIWIEQANATEIAGLHLQYFLKAGLRLYRASYTSDTSVYESFIHNVKITGLTPGYGTTTEADRPDYGIEVSDGATDNHFNDIVIRNVKLAGIYEKGANNSYSKIHIFGYPEPTYVSDYGFDLVNGRCLIHQCYLDGSKVGIKMRGENAVIIGNNFYWRYDLTYPEKANSVGIEIDAGINNYVIVGNIFRGEAGYDIKLLGISNGHRFGNVSVNILNKSTEHHYGDMQFKGTISIDKSGDGVELLRFLMERDWSFRQKGTGSTAKLELRPNSPNKSFIISANDGSPAFEVVANDDSNAPSIAYVDGYEVFHKGNRPEGRGTVQSGWTNFTVNLPTAQPDNNYNPLITTTWNAGNVWVDNITTTSFRVNWSNAPTSTQSFGWKIVR